MKRWIVMAALVWCAMDFGGRVYACFGYDSEACETFIRLYTGAHGQTLVCRIR